MGIDSRSFFTYQHTLSPSLPLSPLPLSLSPLSPLPLSPLPSPSHPLSLSPPLPSLPSLPSPLSPPLSPLSLSPLTLSPLSLSPSPRLNYWLLSHYPPSHKSTTVKNSPSFQTLGPQLVAGFLLILSLSKHTSN